MEILQEKRTLLVSGESNGHLYFYDIESFLKDNIITGKIIWIS
jgi:hypothetical protein